MNRFFVDNQEGYVKDITDLECFKGVIPDIKVIMEHYVAQNQYVSEGHTDHIFEPILIGMNTEEYQKLVYGLCAAYPNFKVNYFLNRNMMPVYLGTMAVEVIRIVDSEKMM